MKKIFIFGAGSGSQEVLLAIEQINQLTPTWEVLGFIDKSPELIGTEINGYSVYSLENIDLKPITPVHGVCGVLDSKIRQRIVEEEIEGNNIAADFAFVIGCNTIHTGKGMKMAPLARLNDGLLDLIIVKKVGRLKLLRLFPKVFSGNHISDPVVDYRQVSEFSILPEVQNTLNIDGEMLGNTPVHVKVLEKEMEVLV